MIDHPHDRYHGPQNALTNSDRKRLSAQAQAILDRLEQGTATNVELAAIALKYTGRISDLRAAGYEIQCSKREAGMTVYRLVPKVAVAFDGQQARLFAP